MGALRDMIDTAWLEATDDAAMTDADQQAVELGYRLGFLNALQRIGQAALAEDERYVDAISEAIDMAAES